MVIISTIEVKLLSFSNVAKEAIIIIYLYKEIDI